MSAPPKVLDAIENWNSLPPVPLAKAEVDALCSASDAITAWINSREKGPPLGEAVNAYKEWVLGVLRGEKVFSEEAWIEAYRLAESTYNQIKQLVDRPDDGQAEPKAKMSRQKVAARLEELRGQGEPWTSYPRMAKQLGCSSQTVHSAVRDTPSLQSWAKRIAAPRAVGQPREDPSDDDRAWDDAPRSRELNPRDDVRIREYLEREDLTDADRAFFNGLPNAEEQVKRLDELEDLEAEQAADRRGKLYPRA